MKEGAQVEYSGKLYAVNCIVKEENIQVKPIVTSQHVEDFLHYLALLA